MNEGVAYSRLMAVSNTWAVSDEFMRDVNLLIDTNPNDFRALWGEEVAGTADCGYTVEGSIGILKMSGVITKEPSWLQYYFGGMSTKKAEETLTKMVADSRIQGKILICADSPGGDTAGVDGLASLIQKIRASGTKVWTFVDGEANSAMYWLAAQSDKIYATKLSPVGSIGVYTILRDTSAMAQANGVTVHKVASGEFKAIGAPGTPITPKQLGVVKTRVMAIAQVFFDAVQKGRGIKAADMPALTTGEIWMGNDAVERKLIDGIKTYDEVISAFGAERVTAKSRPNYTGGNRMPQASLKERILGIFEDADDEQPAANDKSLTKALAKAGVTDVDDLNGLLALAETGRAAKTFAMAEAKKQAVRAGGEVDGPKMFAAFISDNTALGDMNAKAAEWSEFADKKYGIAKPASETPTGVTRTSAAKPLEAVAASTENDSIINENDTTSLLEMTSLGRRALANKKG